MIDESRQSIAWGISVGSMYWSTYGLPLSDNESQQENHRRGTSTPASVLLGCAPGEPLRLDCWMPPHPRGTGSDWPPEAIVDCEKGSGRFPLAAAWTGRYYEHTWRWKPDSEYRQLDSLDAICFGAAQLAKLHAHKAPSAIVIPNDFRQREQQKLLDACSAAGVSASLIWLPVAATLAWLEDHRETLPHASPQSDERLIVHVVHADWGHVRCSTLNLVVRTDEFGSRWMPARRRPSVSDWECPGFGWTSVGGCSSANASAVWRSLFGYGDSKPPLRGNPDSTLLHRIARWAVCQSSPLEVDNGLAAHVSKSSSPSIVIFIGDFARQVSGGPRVSSILSPSTTLIADGLSGETLLARGASVFAQHRINNRVSYLDTLPNLELFVDRNNQYEWMPVLGNTEQFVAGGQKWELPTPIEGLSIRRGASSVKLVVAHDEYEGVRELHAKLDHPAEQRQSAVLHVSATPAQGNARLELVTNALVDVPAKTILAKWDQMQVVVDTNRKPVDKEAFLKLQPRAYPELLPRRMSYAKWRAALPLVQELNNLIVRKRPDAIIADGWQFSRLKDSLMAKDQSQTPHDATAVSSDTKVPFDQESLETLKSSLLKLWLCKKSACLPVLSTIVRALGYISVDDIEFEDWLSKNFQNEFHDRQCVLHTSGLAMRSPDNIAKLVKHVFYSGGRLSSPGANELKAISQVLRYRHDATKEIKSDTCEQVIQSCLRIFERGMESGGGGYPFRWSSLIVVYMLRRRMFDLDFLDPERELATKAKELFRTAIDRYKQRRLRPLGGSVDLPAALQQMINYIDRKGSGDILMAGE